MWAYASEFLHGAEITLAVSFCALLVGMIVGLFFTLGESAPWLAIRALFVCITTLLRGLPELLVMFTIYFGSTILLTSLMGHYVNVNAFISGVIALGLIFAAYAAQTLRGAYQTIPKGQFESAVALGLNHSYILRRIMLPQLWRFALPGLSNLWLVLLKDSALVSLIGLTDIMMIAHNASAATSQPFNFYCIAGLIYLVFTSLSQLAINGLQWRYKRITG
jgi:arginine transport system permease protein